jgi:hypothetical protein
MAVARLCTLMVHSVSHNPEELVLNPELFHDLIPGDFIYVYEPQNYDGRLVLKVPNMSNLSSRLEISLIKSVADANNLKTFSQIVVEKIHPDQASVDFVEMSFKKQYLERGNFFRLQNAMFGQNIAVNGVQAQIQELRKGKETESVVVHSGIINGKTKFVFRSRSARIIWLVQMSAEMWEFDQVRLESFVLFLAEY